MRKKHFDDFLCQNSLGEPRAGAGFTLTGALCLCSIDVDTIYVRFANSDLCIVQTVKGEYWNDRKRLIHLELEQ